MRDIKLVTLLPMALSAMRPLKSAPLNESSAPVAGASYDTTVESQKSKFDLYFFRVGNFRVYVATIGGLVANDGELPYFWSNQRDAINQIAKWR